MKLYLIHESACNCNTENRRAQLNPCGLRYKLLRLSAVHDLSIYTKTGPNFWQTSLQLAIEGEKWL